MDRLTPVDVKKLALQAAIEIDDMELTQTACWLSEKLFSDMPGEFFFAEGLPEDFICLREDGVMPGLRVADALSACQEHGENCFYLPRVVEEGK